LGGGARGARGVRGKSAFRRLIFGFSGLRRSRPKKGGKTLRLLSLENSFPLAASFSPAGKTASRPRPEGKQLFFSQENSLPPAASGKTAFFSQKNSFPPAASGENSFFQPGKQLPARGQLFASGENDFPPFTSREGKFPLTASFWPAGKTVFRFSPTGKSIFA
jgi:hypothetical protein